MRDRAVDAHVKAAEKADRTDPGQVAAPFAGVVTLEVAEGDTVDAGQTVATIEAMKMEAAITAPVAGTVPGSPSARCSRSRAAICSSPYVERCPAPAPAG